MNTFTDEDVQRAWTTGVVMEHEARTVLAAVAPAIAARALREAANDWDREDKARGFLVPGQASNRARARAERIEADA